MFLRLWGGALVRAAAGTAERLRDSRRGRSNRIAADPIRHRLPSLHMFRRSNRRGFSLVEALVALTLMTIIGGALLARFGDQGRYVADSLDQTVAEGLAQQLMNEIAGCRYVAVGETPNSAASFGPSPYESAGTGRERYNDIDDFHGYSKSPPLDRYGVPMGTEDSGTSSGATRHPKHQTPTNAFANWRQSVAVYFVDDTNPTVRLPAGTGSFHKEVEVVVSYNDPLQGTVELARLSRVFAYVPTP
jgi:type II secretory pathway pseudopilin PulG